MSNLENNENNKNQNNQPTPKKPKGLIVKQIATIALFGVIAAGSAIIVVAGLNRTKDKTNNNFEQSEQSFDSAGSETDLISETISETVSEAESENLSELISESQTDQSSEFVSEQTSESISEQTSEQISERVSEKTSEKESESHSEKQSEKESESHLISEIISEKQSEKESESHSEKQSEKESESHLISEIISEKESEKTSEISDYSKYSKTFQTIMTGDYYNALYTSGINAKTSNHYECIPYGYLEERGFNINKIKNNELYCYTEIYIDGNDLYVECRAEKESSTNYIANLLLKYTLTNQEVKELNALYRDVATSGSPEVYNEAPLFVQEISYTHTPTLLSEAYCTKEVLDGAAEAAQHNKEIVIYPTTFFIGAEVHKLGTIQHFYCHYHCGYRMNNIKAYSPIYKIKKPVLKGSYFEVDGVKVYTKTVTSYNVKVDEEPVGTYVFYNCHDLFRKSLRNHLDKISNLGL